MDDERPSCPQCGRSLFNDEEAFYCDNCEMEFCPICLHALILDEYAEPTLCVHYVITGEGFSYFDYLNRIPSNMTDDDDKNSSIISTVLEESGIPFKTSAMLSSQTVYIAWYCAIGGNAAWQQLVPLIEKELQAG